MWTEEGTAELISAPAGMSWSELEGNSGTIGAWRRGGVPPFRLTNRSRRDGGSQLSRSRIRIR
jgi:hypothetical protein